MKTKNLQPDQKIFFLGLNKNATTTFYNFFYRNGYKAHDSASWWYFQDKKQFRDDEVFTDGYEKKFRAGTDPKFDCWPNIHFLNETFPNSYYILQTRPMKDWLLSRQLKYLSGSNISIDKINDERVFETIHEDYVLRLYWHQKIKFYSNTLFSESKKQFLILDISLENSKIIEKLENFLEVTFTDRLLIERNRTTWIDNDVTNHINNLVIKYLEQRKYEI